MTLKVETRVSEAVKSKAQSTLDIHLPA